jgi:hypothetical protein
MILNCTNLPWPLRTEFINLLQHEISSAGVFDCSGAVISFRDPDYDCYSGGYHPVEIAVNSNGQIQYITDFALYGIPPHVELAKEIDFDFSLQRFRHMDSEFPIRHGKGLYQIWEQNFISYYQNDAYRVDVSPWE